MSNAFEPEWHGEMGGNRTATLNSAAGSQHLGASIVEVELLGEHNVKNYDGSWTEWGNLVGVPIEKSEPRAQPT